MNAFRWKMHKMLLLWLFVLFFFFKQKTAYEFRLSVVGSKMGVKDKY